MWHIARLADVKVDRRIFRCGDQALDLFLHQYASQYERRNLGRTYLALTEDLARIAGYYTLSNSAVSFESVPIKVPRHPIPTVLLARLAVDETFRGQRVGEFLLLDALRRSLEISRHAAVFAVEVDAYDTAVSFYEKYGFRLMRDDPRHLFIPIATIAQLSI